LYDANKIESEECRLLEYYAMWLWQSSVLPLQVTGNFVPTSPILVTLMMETIHSSETFLQEPHGVTSQKTELFIVTAVKISNLTKYKVFVLQQGSF
jgi:hypothetical protein